MGGFFSVDGPFARFGNVLAEIILLGLLWTIFSIPIITAGASTTAVYYVATKRANGIEGYLFQDFWRSFKRNFLPSTLVFLILAAIFILLIFNILNIGLLENFTNIFMVLQLFVLVQSVFISMYIFVLIARFDMKFSELFKAAFFMGNRHFLTTLQNLLILVALVWLTDIFPPFLFIAVGTYCYFSAFIIMRVLKKHRPDLDQKPDISRLEPLNLDVDKEENPAPAPKAEEIDPNHLPTNDHKALNLDFLRQLDKEDTSDKG